MNATKRCSGPCGRTLDPDHFQKCRRAKDGLQWRCRDCIRERDKSRPRRSSSENSGAAARARKRRWQRENRDRRKERARRAVRTAVAKGDMARPEACENCGEGGVRADGATAIQAHHHRGYDHPLDVLWLCPPCHAVADAAMRPQESEDGDE